jgi:hypothetical protein
MLLGQLKDTRKCLKTVCDKILVKIQAEIAHKIQSCASRLIQVLLQPILLIFYHPFRHLCLLCTCLIGGAQI